MNKILEGAVQVINHSDFGTLLYSQRIAKTRKPTIAVLDADGFEVQVFQEQRKFAFTKGTPTVVVTGHGR